MKKRLLVCLLSTTLLTGMIFGECFAAETGMESAESEEAAEVFEEAEMSAEHADDTGDETGSTDAVYAEGDTYSEEPFVNEPPLAVDVPFTADEVSDRSLNEGEHDDTIISLDVAYRTQSQIRSYIEAHPAETISVPDAYASTPSTKVPYDPGTLSENAIEAGIRAINQIRYTAGLEYDVTAKTDYSVQCQAASLLNAVNNTLSHFPTKPQDMDDDLYNTGYKGAGSSNIAYNYGSLAASVLKAWMHDGDTNNVNRVGHRRWILNPTMKETGFGQVGAYTSMYSFDRKREIGSIPIVAWPAQNMPVEWIDSSLPWSVSFGTTLNKDDIKVTLTRKKDGKVWSFSSSNANGYFEVNNDYYGQPGCVIFRPDSISYKDGDIFTVKVEGAIEGKTLQYTVSIFKDAPIEPSSIKLSDYKLTLPVGEEVTILASVLPAKASQQMIFDSSNPAAATVDQAGKIKGVGEGVTRIRVSSKENEEVYADCIVTVVKAKLKAPTFSPKSGTRVFVGDRISIYSSDASATATLMYRIGNGNYQKYSSSILVSSAYEGMTLTFKAYVKSGDTSAFEDSDITEAVLSVSKADVQGDIDDEDWKNLGYDPANIPDGLWVGGLKSTYVYTGDPITAEELRVYYKNYRLTSKEYTAKYKNNIDAGKAWVQVTLKSGFVYKDSYEKTRSFDFQILQADISGSSFDAPDVYMAEKKDKEGHPVEQTVYPVLYYSGVALKGKGSKTDFVTEIYSSEAYAKYQLNKLKRVSRDGIYYARLDGQDNFCGTRIIKVIVQDFELKDIVKVKPLYDTTKTYTGDPIYPDATLTYKDEGILTPDDYVLTYGPNTDVGTGYINVAGKGSYTGKKNLTFKIVPYNISENEKLMTVSLGSDSKASLTYLKNEAVFDKDEISVVSDELGRTLKNGRDYTVKYYNNNSYGNKTPYVVITGKGNYTGSITRMISILQADIERADMIAGNVEYKAKPGIYKTVPALYDTNGKALQSGVDYEKVLSYTYRDYTNVKQKAGKGYVTHGRMAGQSVDPRDLIPAGTVLLVTATGKGFYTGTVSAEYRVAAHSMKGIVFSCDKFYYTGKEIKPDLVGLYDTKEGIRAYYKASDGSCFDASTNLQVISYSSNVKTGTGKAVIVGAGDYAGKRTVSFKILPERV